MYEDLKIPKRKINRDWHGHDSPRRINETPGAFGQWVRSAVEASVAIVSGRTTIEAFSGQTAVAAVEVDQELANLVTPRSPIEPELAA